MLAVHPTDTQRFVTADESGAVLKYNVETRLLEGRTVLGFKCCAVAISSAQSKLTCSVCLLLLREQKYEIISVQLLPCQWTSTCVIQHARASAGEEYAYEDMKSTWRSQGPEFAKCWHIAVSGKKGRTMILKWDNFQPLASIPAKGIKEGICDLKFTPAGAPTPMLAASSHDRNIYIYNITKAYQYDTNGDSGLPLHVAEHPRNSSQRQT
jgi:hypothetical protein